jgi:hypothetical protein
VRSVLPVTLVRNLQDRLKQKEPYSVKSSSLVHVSSSGSTGSLRDDPSWAWEEKFRTDRAIQHK